MVSIVILSYNTSELLKKCLESIYLHLQGKFEVIVVDNASKDESVKMVKDTFKKVRLIENPHNSGFAGGCNLGAASAKGEHILFLNSDAEVKDNPLPILLQTFNDHDNVAVVGGILENYNGSLQRSFGDFYTIPNIITLLFVGENGELKKYTDEKEMETDWVSGGFMMTDSAHFRSVKGFNESYFMYIEDMDLCYRLRKKGLKVFVNPDARIKHLGQGSSNKAFAIIHIYMGLQIFYQQQRGILEYYTVKLLLLVKAVLALIVGLLTLRKNLISTYYKALKTL
jgi:GT2 family glycosyltransferase